MGAILRSGRCAGIDQMPRSAEHLVTPEVPWISRRSPALP
ncbi:hypothetical protein SZ55_0964 [Pseudomonas sp. FeS53a]|nr:hypothetical protein SZ55_0964 [Pseudomonas sp. FeS53a]